MTTLTSTATHATCEFCHWWSKRFLPGQLMNRNRPGTLMPFALGECRKKAPGMQPMEDGRMFTRWPTTKAEDFCAEHQPRVPAPESTAAA